MAFKGESTSSQLPINMQTSIARYLYLELETPNEMLGK